MTSNFQVDLGGVVDLLSRHLYTTPQVYLRELVQNAVDALTARRLSTIEQPDPADEPSVLVVPSDCSDDGRLLVADNGIGLSRDDITAVLSTIGRSSKRDDLGFARQDFLGQFGIGLLSCFLVTDEIELRTRAVGSDLTWTWHGRADGTYEIVPAAQPLPQPGTEVRLTPRPGQEAVTRRTQVAALLHRTTRHLPHRILLAGPAGSGEAPTDVAGESFCWEDPGLSGLARRQAAIELCRAELGFTPFDVIPLSDSGSGTRGYAFVLPAVAGRTVHRIYSHHMLVSEANDQVLPESAFFVRAILDTDHLPLTASREGLQEGTDLAEVRERLGGQVRAWLDRTANTDPRRFGEFLSIHQLGAKALATRDDSVLDLVARFLSYETTIGDLVLDDLAGQPGPLHHCPTSADYRQVSATAAAHDLVVINAGYAYDESIVARWAELRQRPVTRLDPQDLVAHLDDADAADRALFATLVDVAADALARTPVRPEARPFRPARLPVLLLAHRDPDVGIRADAQDSTAGVWAALVGSLAQVEPPAPRFVINTANPEMRRLAASGDRDLQQVAVEALYAHALVTGRHRQTPYDAAVVSRALPALITRTLDRLDQP